MYDRKNLYGIKAYKNNFKYITCCTFTLNPFQQLAQNKNVSRTAAINNVNIIECYVSGEMNLGERTYDKQ